MWGRKMENQIILTALALMCLIGSISVAAASQETRLNIYPNFETCVPSIQGNIVTFSEVMGESTQMYNLSSGKQIGLSTYESGNGASISGNNIVWYQDSPTQYQVMLYNTATKKTTTLVDGNSPAIYGNIVTYVGNSGGIYTYDLSTKKNIQIITSVTAYDPQIYGNYIVYVDNDQVYVYSISAKQQSIIGAGTIPNIYGNVVVWANNGNIYKRDIVAHKTTQITTNGRSENPAIYDKNIVWYIYYGDQMWGNICTYTNGKTTQLTKSNSAADPAIYGDKVVYLDYRNSNEHNMDTRDLFVYDLTAKLSKPDATTFAANTTSGTYPLTVFFSYTENGDMPTSYLWNFGDGITSTHAWTATHTYTKAGTYTVSLKVTNSAGSNTETKTKYIIVK
jgi:beta propeller repeat protein